MEQMKVDGAVKDYVKIAYQGSDALYVPATQLDLVSKYIGGGEDAPVKLNKLGGDQWQKAKAKAKAAAMISPPGLSSSTPSASACRASHSRRTHRGRRSSRRAFEYAETDDQLRCIDEIKHDMESPAPMDRLLCGDVGFGKTEVALRAAMKCILDGKQVAILVPTTVLAQQHYVTATSRFGSFPVTIDALALPYAQSAEENALRSAHRQDRSHHRHTQAPAKGHPLQGSRPAHHRRGAALRRHAQRSALRNFPRRGRLNLIRNAHPRTLNMALSGLRDMSTIEEPPQDRYPVQTFVLEHNETLLLDAIRRSWSAAVRYSICTTAWRPSTNAPRASRRCW